jgi:long-chain acyl-CoA synthetase
MDALPARTLLDYFAYAASSGKPDLLVSKVRGKWTPVSAADFGRKTRGLAVGLASLGVDRGDRVAILSENRPEWPMADFAALALGGVTVPVYTSYLPPQIEYLLNDSAAKVVVVSGAFELAKVLEVAPNCLSLKHVISMEDPDGAPGVVQFDEVVRRGEQILSADPTAFDDRVKSVVPTDQATMIYTSGTTGEPKGAVLSHQNFVSNVVATSQYYPCESTEVALSFLPLAHVFERMADYLYFSRRVTITYAESIEKLSENFQEVRPHFFAAVPRVYEKMLARVQAAVEQAPAIRRKIFAWGTGVGAERARLLQRHDEVPFLLGLQYKLADKLVFSKVKARLGGRFRFAISGGAPLGRETAEFFWGAGVEVYEGYGLTETSPVLCCNRPGAWKLGSVGRPIDGVKIVIAPDGEVLAKGLNIMEGYWRKPEETAKSFDSDGWFRTGDIGRFDEDGFLTLTDRKKEILVNAYGKNIAPAPIEGALKMTRYIASAVLIGDRRKFLSALIAPNFDNLKTWCDAHGVTETNPHGLIALPKVRALFQGTIDFVNGSEPSEHRIKAFTLLASDFSIEGGELTPTLKVKRRVVAQKYRKEIDDMYAAADAEEAANPHG